MSITIQSPSNGDKVPLQGKTLTLKSLTDRINPHAVPADHDGLFAQLANVGYCRIVIRHNVVTGLISVDHGAVEAEPLLVRVLCNKKTEFTE